MISEKLMEIAARSPLLRPAPLDLDLTVASSGSNIPPLSVSVFMLFAVASKSDGIITVFIG